MLEGWKCPVCGKGNAPFALTCGHCKEAEDERLTRYFDEKLRNRLSTCGQCGARTDGGHLCPGCLSDESKSKERRNTP